MGIVYNTASLALRARIYSKNKIRQKNRMQMPCWHIKTFFSLHLDWIGMEYMPFFFNGKSRYRIAELELIPLLRLMRFFSMWRNQLWSFCVSEDIIYEFIL